MAGFRVLLRCVGAAVAAQGLRGLVGLIPFGDRLYDIASDAFERFRTQARESEMQAQVQAAVMTS